MTSSSSKPPLSIRPLQYRDLVALESLAPSMFGTKGSSCLVDMGKHLPLIRRWYGLLRFISFFPNPLQHAFRAYIAEQDRQLQGAIQVSPFNRTRSTWRVERIGLSSCINRDEKLVLSTDVGSQLLRHCLQIIWEARTWLLEVEINETEALGLYRQNGFQPLAQMTYWELPSNLLQELATTEPDLPNLLPVSNADAQLLYQLDTASMPPLVRQVFDRHIQDFKTSLASALIDGFRQWVNCTEVVSGYVFESQRKAAIGHFQLTLSRDGSKAHTANLTVHPAYTWLYPELLAQMARIAADVPPQALQLTSADYQPEREEYLGKLGAERIEHTLMMSRSVWHKLREGKPMSLDGLQLPDVLKGLQPAPPGKPVPGRMSWSHSGATPSRIHPNAKQRPTKFNKGNSARSPLSRERTAGNNGTKSHSDHHHSADSARQQPPHIQQFRPDSHKRSDGDAGNLLDAT